MVGFASIIKKSNRNDSKDKSPCDIGADGDGNCNHFDFNVDIDAYDIVAVDVERWM